MTKTAPPTIKIIETETEMTCPNCGGGFSFNEDDISEFNTVQCPWCNRDIELNFNKIVSCKFPNDFFHFGNKDGGYALSTKETQELIDRVKKQETQINLGEFYCISLGDTCVIGLKYEEEFTIIVAKDYYEFSKYCD